MKGNTTLLKWSEREHLQHFIAINSIARSTDIQVLRELVAHERLHNGRQFKTKHLEAFLDRDDAPHLAWVFLNTVITLEKCYWAATVHRQVFCCASDHDELSAGN